MFDLCPGLAAQRQLCIAVNRFCTFSFIYQTGCICPNVLAIAELWIRRLPLKIHQVILSGSLMPFHKRLVTYSNSTG